MLTLFTLQDNSPWATFAGPILAAVKAYAPDGITWSALYEESAPLKWIAQFYGETIHNESFKDRQRAQALQENKAFSTAGAGKERSEEALVEQNDNWLINATCKPSGMPCSWRMWRRTII